MFCPKCGSILKLKKEGNKRIMACSCGYIDKGGEKTKLHEKVNEKTEISIIENENHETLPSTEAKCQKCGHNEAYYWLVQTRSGDESQTKFLKCKSCKHIWRDYD